MIAKLLDNNNLPYASQSDSETESTVDANGDFHGVWAREVRLFSLIFLYFFYPFFVSIFAVISW